MMIQPTDRDYIDTKLIKQGKRRLLSPFMELSEWIQYEYNVIVINVYYDYIMPEKCPRLNIVFEFKKDELLFRDSQDKYDNEKQGLIAAKFKALTKLQNKNNFFFGYILKLPQLHHDTKDIFVTFSSFDSVAKIEANQKVSQTQIQELKENLSNNNIWKISTPFSGVIFFFYTEEQVEENSKNGVKEFLTKKYFDLLKPYDEFNYFKKDEYQIYLDSKENFEKNYKSNWFNYYA